MLSKFPLAVVAKAIDPETFDYTVSEAAQELFVSSTKESFEPPLVTTADDRISLTCPCCDGGQEYAWPWIDDKGTGWAQRDFRARCPHCQVKFDHMAYGVRRFCDEVVMWRNAQATPASKNTFYLAYGFRAARYCHASHTLS